MPYSEEDEEEVTVEETEEETEESSEEETEGGGGLLGGLLGGAGLGGIGGKVTEQVQGGGLNVGQLIDDATEDKGGMVKTAGDLIGGFLNKNKSE